tara:strand:- start:311 stop:994 length:684 start_codon:yes stop_codon:yes gene_type:complete
MDSEIKNGKFILYNTDTSTSGIEIHYTGNVTITPLVPEGWIFRANKKKILIFNLGTNTLGNQQELFSFIGKFNIRYGFVVNKNLERTDIMPSNPKRNWSNSYHADQEISTMTENWDSIQDQNDISAAKKSKFIPKRTISPNIVNNNNISVNHSTDGGEYTLNGKDYKGKYHIHKDIGVAMTGAKHNKKAKLLLSKSQQAQTIYSTSKKQADTKAADTKSQSQSTGGY